MNLITKRDQSLLLMITECRILLIDQIALLNQTGKRTVQRKISRLFNKGFLNLSARNNPTIYGRPENIISISEIGAKFLQNENLIDKNISAERILLKKLSNFEHELLINWFRILLNNVAKKLPDLAIDFISATTPFLPLKSTGLPLISESIINGKSNYDFIPDGVFSIICKKQNKSLLFFLEVDLGTESLKSSSSNSNTIAAKIKNYRVYFQSQKYKRYEKKWNTKFNGFRLLFLTNTTKRKISISNLVILNKPNEFIWVSNEYDMFEKGLGGKIWAIGGNIFISHESILGPTLNYEEKLI